MSQLYAEPIRYAYPPGAVITALGPGGRERMQEALASLAAGTADPAVASALAPGSVLALAWNPGATARMLAAPASPGMPVAAPAPPARYVTLRVTPGDGAVAIAVTVPTTAARDLQQAFAARALGQPSAGSR